MTDTVSCPTCALDMVNSDAYHVVCTNAACPDVDEHYTLSEVENRHESRWQKQQERDLNPDNGPGDDRSAQREAGR